MSKETLNNYNKKVDEAYEDIINFIVKNNLCMPLKISGISLREITVTGEVKERKITVVEEMFTDDKMPESVSTPGTPDVKCEEEIPVIIVNKDEQARESIVAELQKMKPLPIKKPGFFARLKGSKK